MWITEGDRLSPSDEIGIETVPPLTLKGIGTSTSARQDGVDGCRRGREGTHGSWAWKLTFNHGTMSLALGARPILSMTWVHLFWDLSV